MEAESFGGQITIFVHFLHESLQHLEQFKYLSGLMRLVWMAGENLIAVVANAKTVVALSGLAKQFGPVFRFWPVGLNGLGQCVRLKIVRHRHLLKGVVLEAVDDY